MARRWNQQSKLFPELQLFASDSDRAEAMKLAMKGTFRSWRVWGALLAVCLGCAALVLGVRQAGLMPQWFGASGLGGFVGGLTGGSAMGVALYVRNRYIRRRLRQQLIDRGIPICLECGYQLRGLREPRCPECGATFDPGLLADNNTGQSDRPD